MVKKVANQLCGPLCFRYIDSIIPLLSKSKISSLYLSSVAAQPICVRPGQRLRRQVFSKHGSYNFPPIFQRIMSLLNSTGLNFRYRFETLQHLVSGLNIVRIYSQFIQFLCEAHFHANQNTIDLHYGNASR